MPHTICFQQRENFLANRKSPSAFRPTYRPIERLATVALYKLNNVWIKGNKLKTSTKIKLCKSPVKSILLYNCGTWALTVTEEERLNAYHRKQIKKILNTRYSKKKTNKSFYRICQEKSLSLQILSARWSLFGHIVRRDKDIPANKATRAYFIPNGNKLRGRPKTTFPIVLNRDLSLIQDPIRLHSSKKPGRDHRTSTRQEMLEGINIKDRESCRSVAD